MNFTYRSVTSDTQVVEIQQFPQYRQFLQSIDSISHRFAAAFHSFSGVIFGHSDDFILEMTKPMTSGDTKLLLDNLAKKLREDCTSAVLVLFK